MEKRKLFVIIVTWNGMRWIRQCLDSLSKSIYPINTVVIDNGSHDETVTFVRQNYPRVHIIETGKNLGFGQANNEGIRYALKNDCDYVYLLNQDAYVYPDMFQLLIDEAEMPENQKRFAIYSPLHVFRDGKSLDKQFKGYLKDIASTIVEDQCLGTIKSIYPVNGVPAAGWLLPKKTLDTVGGFDPIFFHYGEDHHYCQRVNYLGYKTGVVLKAKMVHDRDGFGNAAMAKEDMIFRSLKTEIFLNINLSITDCIRKLSNLFIIFTFQSIVELLHGNFYMVKEYQKAFVLNFLFLGKYSKNRKKNKVVGPNWL